MPDESTAVDTPDAALEGAPAEGGTAEDFSQASDSQEQTEEKLYAGKFKSVEELEKGYREADKALTQKSQEAAENKRLIDEFYGEDEETLEPQREGNQSNDAYLDQPTVDQVVDERIAPLREELTQAKNDFERATAEAQISRAEADLGKEGLSRLAPEIKQVMQEIPELRKPGRFNDALKLAQARTMPETIKEATDKGEQSATVKAEKAEQAQTESAKGGERAAKTNLAPESIARMSSDELEQFLPKK